jgi:hypothetical protein
VKTVTAERFDPEGGDPATLRVTGWAWYRIDSMLFLVATDSADPADCPGLEGDSPPVFWRLSELARTAEEGDADPWREQMARALLRAVAIDLAADPGLGGFRR